MTIPVIPILDWTWSRERMQFVASYSGYMLRAVFHKVGGRGSKGQGKSYWIADVAGPVMGGVGIQYAPKHATADAAKAYAVEILEYRLAIARGQKGKAS